MKTKRISFDIDEDTLDTLKNNAKKDHRSLASYLRTIMYNIAYNDRELPSSILDTKKDTAKSVNTKDLDEVSFSINKPKMKGGF